MLRNTILMILLSSVAVMAKEGKLERNFEAGGATQLNVVHAHGNVKVIGWDKSEVQMKGVKKATGSYAKYFDDLYLEMSVEGDTVEVRTIRPKVSWKWGWGKSGSMTINYELYVPRNMDVRLKNSHGKSSIADIGGRVNARNSHGSFYAENIGGDVDVDASHGSVKMNEIAGSIDVSNSHGSLKVDGIGGEAFVNASHGRVTLHEVAGSVQVESNHGSVTVVTSDSFDGPINLKANHGSIALSLPESFGANLNAKTSHGGIKNEFGINVKKAKHNSSLQSKIGGGGTDVRLRTNHGSISILSL